MTLILNLAQQNICAFNSVKYFLFFSFNWQLSIHCTWTHISMYLLALGWWHLLINGALLQKQLCIGDVGPKQNTNQMWILSRQLRQFPVIQQKRKPESSLTSAVYNENSYHSHTCMYDKVFFLSTF